MTDKHLLSRLVIAAALCACGSLAAVAAQAQSSWQSRADVLSAGAAASIVSFHACSGDSREAGEQAHARLSQLAQTLAIGSGSGLREVQVYLAEATNTKVRALWQANQGRDCSRLANLKQMARGTGFDAPQ